MKAAKFLLSICLVIAAYVAIVPFVAEGPLVAQYTPPRGATGATGPQGPSGPGTAAVTAVNSSITATSLGTTAVCALHTDTPDGVHACNNPVTDATAANCPAGTLSAPCTFPTSITIPANSLGSNTNNLLFSIGSISTATLPTLLVEMYLDSVRIYAATAAIGVAGSRSTAIQCTISGLASNSTAPVVTNCTGNGNAGGINANFGSNSLITNTAPAIAINTTVSHVLKVSIAYSAATTGNSAWLYGMRFSQ